MQRWERVLGIWAAVAVGAALLVVAGFPKLIGASVVPQLPSWTSRPLGAAEVVVGTWVLISPSPILVAAMALVYLALAGALVVALVRREPDCGCFGVEPVRPSVGHLVVNVVFAASALTAWWTLVGASGEPGWAAEPTPIRVLTPALALLSAVMLAELMSTVAEIRHSSAALRGN